jgi:DNA-binding CsgD family transcriptional regulator
MKPVIVRKKNTISITDKDVKIVEMIASGMRASDIGEKFKRSPRTIEFSIDRLKEKFGAKTQPELVAMFFRHKIIS